MSNSNSNSNSREAPMGWGSQIKSSGGKYLKIGAGEEARVVVYHAPWTVDKTWDDGSTSTRYIFAVYNLDEMAPQILEVSAGVASSVGKALDKKGYDSIIMLAREGTGKATRWNVVGIGKPDAAMRRSIDAEGPEPFDLGSEVNGAAPMIDAPPSRQAPSVRPDEDVPF